jgi:hypothetical protein
MSCWESRLGEKNYLGGTRLDTQPSRAFSECEKAFFRAAIFSLPRSALVSRAECSSAIASLNSSESLGAAKTFKKEREFETI